MSMMVSDIKTTDIENALADIADGARNAFLRLFKTLFNYAIERGYSAKGSNPIRDSSFADRPKHDREIIPPDKVATILNYALEHSPEIVPYLAITFWTGVRPQDEALELDWSNIMDGKVVVFSHVSKTEDLREIPLSDNAKAWLQAYTARGGITDGKIMPLAEHHLTPRRKAAYRAAGYEKIPQDSARHSYASFWLPVNNNNLGELLERMGHSDLRTLKNHYLRHATVEASQKYWSIMPPVNDGKIVAFAA